MLSIKNLSLTFLGQKSEAFRNIDLDIRSGEILLLTGRSGVGKSALLMCITGVIPETYEGEIKGDIFFQGEDLRQKKPCQIAGEIGYLFQDPDSQLCTFTVADEIAFGLENLNVPAEQMEKRIDEALEMVGISELKKRKIQELSGGEKQKVALCAVLVMEPKLVLLDEPTANLDPKATREVAELVEKLNREKGITFLLIEHKQEAFAGIGTRMLQMASDGITALRKDMWPVERKSLFGEVTASKETTDKETEPYENKVLVQEEEPHEIRVEGLCFGYPGKPSCLNELSFSVRKGEIFAIAGKNGAGKTTLSKLLMGLEKPNRGQILIKGKPLNSFREREFGKMIGYVFQNPEHQFIRETVEQELGLSLQIAGVDKETTEIKVQEALEKFHLVKHRKGNPFQLSQGEKRRLSTAAMMMNGQSILILDEPTYGQDQENLSEMVQRLKEIHKQGVTVIMITHDLFLMASLADRIALLEDGQLLYEGEYTEALIQQAFFGESAELQMGARAKK